MADIASFANISVTYASQFKSWRSAQQLSEDEIIESVSFSKAFAGTSIFSMGSSILATTFITGERYVHITRPFDYHRYINTKSVTTCLLVTWLIPIAAGLGTGFVTRGVNAASGGEKNVPNKNLAIAILICTMLLFFFILMLNLLYGKILIKYWQMKRRNSMRRKGLNVHQCTVKFTAGLGNGKMDCPISSDNRDTPILLCVRNLEGGQYQHTNQSTSPTLQFSHSDHNDMINEQCRSSRNLNNFVLHKHSGTAAIRRATDFMNKAKYIFALIFIFTVCWMPVGIYFIVIIISYIDGQQEMISDERCTDLQMHYSNVSSQYGAIQNEWRNKPRLDMSPCIHNLVTTDRKECVIYVNAFDNYNEYDICRDALYATSNYVAGSFLLVVWNIAALNSVFNPLIYGFMSSDFKTQINKIKRRICIYLGNM